MPLLSTAFEQGNNPMDSGPDRLIVVTFIGLFIVASFEIRVYMWLNYRLLAPRAGLQL
jgi:hypothetical protein